MDFVGVFGLILIIISLIIFYNAPFKAENENCPEDVKGAKQNKIGAIATLSSGVVCVITWLIYNIINW